MHRLLTIALLAVCISAPAQTNAPKKIARPAAPTFARGTNETVLILSVEPLGAFMKCLVLSGKIRKAVIADGLPRSASQHFADLSKLQSQAAQLSQFVTTETKRLRWQATQLPAEAATYGVETPAMRAIRKFNEDSARLDTTKENLDALTEKIKDVIADTPELIGYPTGQFFYSLPVWDFRK